MTDREAAAGLVERLESLGDEYGAVSMTYGPAGEALREAAAEIKRLQALFITQNEAHRVHVKGLLKQHESERELYGDAAQGFRERAEAAEARALKAEKEGDEWNEKHNTLSVLAQNQGVNDGNQITHLRALVAEAVRVCEPFEHEADEYPLKPDNERPEGIVWFDFGDLRAARAFIEKAKS